MNEVADILRKWKLLPSEPEEVWPKATWSVLVNAEATGWCIPKEFGGSEMSVADLLEFNLELARGHLAAAFILSQFQAACQRIVRSDRRLIREQWLPRLARGKAFATVGISHLSTSRQHQARPAVSAAETGDGYSLTGAIPWVTSGNVADVLVTGGTLNDGRQVLAAVPSNRSGVVVEPGVRLLALTGSSTGPVRLEDVRVTTDEVLFGPGVEILKSASDGGAGSLTTSALATGHALACLDQLAIEAESRRGLQPAVDALQGQIHALKSDLRNAAGRNPGAATPEALRTRATSLALDASQALMTASKGAGFVAGHPAERLAREALFFLVWSCPQPVASQLLSEFGRCEL